jgi:hypothetical protein
VSQAILDAFWLQGMQAGIPGILASIKAFSESDHADDLKTIDVPTLILHGDDDQIVPIAASAMVSATLVKGSTLKVFDIAARDIPVLLCGATGVLRNPTNARFPSLSAHSNHRDRRTVSETPARQSLSI